MSTGVPDLQEELIDLIAAASGFEEVAVAFAPPLEVPKRQERVYGLAEAGYSLGGGEQMRNEVFSLRLAVEVFQPGNDPRTANRRKWALIDAIDELLSDEDFHGYQSYGFTLTAESELVAWDKGYLARSVLSIGTEEEV